MLVTLRKADVDMKQADLDSITDANVRKNITNTTTKFQTLIMIER